MTNSTRCATLALFLFLLSGCAGQPRVCPRPEAPPAEAVPKLPEPGHFEKKLREVLKQGQT